MPSFMAKLNGETMAKTRDKNKKTTFRWFFTTLLIIDFILLFPWYPEWDLNPHSANAEGF